MNGRILLAGVLRWEPAELEGAFVHCNEYREIAIPKKNGQRRLIYEPHPQVKRFQRRFLRYFLYRTLKRDWMDRYIIGFMPRRSIMENADYHLRPETRYTYSFDFKDAFPSVSADHLRQLLDGIVFEEIECYAKVISGRRTAEGRDMRFPNPPLFSTRKVKWFRNLFKTTDPYLLANQPDLHVVLDEFVEMAVSLLTYQGRLPQGAPTSPYLLNLLVARSNLLQNIRNMLAEPGLGAIATIYADDIMISVAKALPRPIVRAIEDQVAASGVFSVNQQKTRCYNAARIAPLVTGLRLVRYTPSYKQRRKIDTVVRMGSGYGSHVVRRPPREKLLRDTHDKVQTVLTVSVPKRTLKKIRGLIHQAKLKPELRPRVDGYISFLRSVYGEMLPNQVARPYRSYQAYLSAQADR